MIKKVKKEKSIYDRVKQDKSVVRVKWLLEFAPQSWNGYLTENLQTLLRTNNAEVMELTLDWIERLNIAESRNALLYAEQHMEDRKRNRVRILIDRYNHITPPPDRALVESKMSSIKWEDRLFALTALLKKPELLKHGILNPLLKDNDFQVRISAIRLIGVYKLTEYTQELLELLDDDRFYAFAWNSLHKMSSEILSSLDKVFNKPDVSRRKLERVIRLIALSESDERINYLVGKLNRSEDFILRYTLKSLAESDFRPYEQTRIRLKEILFKYTGMAAWNMSVLESCQFNKLNPELVKAMDLEYKQAYQVIFYTLSVLHGRSAIGEIQRNIESGIAESIGYSIELMDLFIDEDIKEWLFVFFEAGRKTNRIKKLQMSFPVSLLRGEALLHAIINRDYNYINTFTRVLAIKELEKLKNYTVGETLIAQLFNPDDIVAESSVQQVIKHDPDILADVIPRLPDKRREQIISILERKTTRRFGDSLETYRYLKKCLHNSD
ncbi:MAG: HEAT repeat domain-containing protein, partial [Bacteroidales bacterium]